MDNIENKFNAALTLLDQGKTLEEVLLMYPEQSEELKPLLALAQQLQTFPKRSVPEPARQRKYILATQERWWVAWLHLSKFANVSVGLLLLISALAGTGYAASRSVPGQALFSIKSFAEQTQLAFASSPEEKANLQVEIAQKRLTEAQQVFNDPQANPAQEQAALNELLNQTQNAIEVASTVAKNNPQQPKNQEVVSSLATITKQQQALLSQIKPQGPLANEASTALKQVAENANKVEAIQKYIATASKEESLTNLASPSSTPESLTGEVKGASTTSTSSVTSIKLENNNTSTSTDKKLGGDGQFKKDNATDNNSDTSTPPQADPNTATATFIPEDPSPQSPF